MSSVFVPPGGMASVSQQTPAAKASMGLLRTGTRAAGAKRGRKRKAKRATGKRKAKRAARGKGGRKLAFGSPAWRKKYMRKKKRG